MLLRPELWMEWFQALLHAQGGPQLASGIFAVPLVPRLVVAVVLLWWGARATLTWVVPIAVALGLPVLWDHGMAIMLRPSGWRCTCTGGSRVASHGAGSPQPAMTASPDPATA